jgi:hypothetical protein
LNPGSLAERRFVGIGAAEKPSKVGTGFASLGILAPTPDLRQTFGWHPDCFNPIRPPSVAGISARPPFSARWHNRKR